MVSGAKSSFLTFVALHGWAGVNFENLKHLSDTIKPFPAVRIKTEKKSKKRK